MQIYEMDLRSEETCPTCGKTFRCNRKQWAYQTGGRVYCRYNCMPSGGIINGAYDMDKYRKQQRDSVKRRKLK